ncbi:LOW QUALITY PROTEIN: hypothetical protein Cgig2_002030 [Carnegiea gigantea]|uniref:Peptidase A2 domain-containing protein n=1 Tax=Carnegiea gigantea TaxID=171969 RepID=A0A9Q1GIK0_9CARY|nr:LOW QUALITY PROTEIN: hypothetical protein Cgig2_002030 [Carnegiea gigantea]
MVDTLKNFMSAMTNTITRQVSEQVKRAMEVANSASPLPGCEPSHRTTRSTRDSGTRCPPHTRGNGQVYHWLHSLCDPFQANRLAQRTRQEPVQPRPRDEECSMEIMASITGGYTEGMTRSAWKAQLRGMQQVLMTEQGPHLIAPTMVFGAKEAPHFAFPHNDPLVVEMKIARAIVRRILVDTGSSIDIITWDYLKKMTHSGRDIVPLVHLILGFGGQEVNPNSMNRLPLCFGGKLKAKNLEVDFLVIDLPIAYNYWVASPSSLQHSAATLAPRENASAIVTSCSVILGGPEVPAVATSQDLTKSWISENLDTGLDKVGGRPFDTQGRAADGLISSPYGLRGGSLLWGTGGAVHNRTATRVSRGRLVGSCFPSLAGGGCRYLIGTPVGSLALINRVYLLSLLVHEAVSLLFPPALDLGCHLLWSGIPDFKDCQPCPRLLCIKQEGSQIRTKQKAD